MTRTLALLAATLLLSSCGGDEETKQQDEEPRAVTEPVSGRVSTQDDSVSLVLPEGWEKYAAEELDGVVVLAANQADDEGEQVFVSRFDSLKAAEDAAIYAATGMVAQGAKCRSWPRNTTFGAERRVLDCDFTDPEPFHKVLIPIGDATRGAMLLVQTDGDTLADTAGRITPILDSWRWS